MNDHTLEIRDDGINAEEIMKKIRESIHRKKAGEDIAPGSGISITSPFLEGRNNEFHKSIKRDLELINSNWDLQNNSYIISSHHPVLGKFLVKGRQIVHGEVRRYIDPIISRQTEFNASTVRLLVQITEKCGELENTFSRLELEFNDSINTVKTELQSKNEIRIRESESKNETNIHELELKVETLTRELFSQLDADIKTRASLAHALEERISKGWSQKGSDSGAVPVKETNYFLFEERFRGSREDIKQRQLSFLPYFERCSRVLDIGCGRGEFLELLRDNNIAGIGVDLDPDMIAYCQSRSLDAEQTDAITYLEKQEDKSLDGIFIDQVVEHLEPEYLIRLLSLCYQKLKFGYYLVVETVNPLSFVSFVNFYIDMTHKRPVHPETLQFLLGAAGFRESEKKFFSPVSDESRLKKISDTSGLDEPARKNAEVYNRNIELLNSVLFGAQDYAIIGKK